MAYTITNQCISCSRCDSACPTGAVKVDNGQFWIDSSLCNGCVGYYGVPQCQALCPTNGGCIPDVQEFWDKWFVKYNSLILRLREGKQAEYWESWFDAYSQKVSHLYESCPISPASGTGNMHIPQTSHKQLAHKQTVGV